MKMKSVVSALWVMLLFCPGVWHEVAAQPNLGGEIRWECTSQGNYRFIVTRYRDCQAICLGHSMSIASNAPGFPTISLQRVEIKELTAGCGCPNGGSISCATPHIPPGLNGATQAYVFTTDATYPAGVPLTGVPPASGWYFAYSSCCRGPVVNLGSYTCSFTIVSWMYPYVGTQAGNCYDNAPAFLELPSPAFCAGQVAVLSHNASDADGDSLAYELAPLLGSSHTVMQNWAPGYSALSPFPGTIQNPSNVPASMLPGTGMISLKSYTSGRFAYAVMVSSYRNGVKIAAVMREFYVVILPCDESNTPPGIAIPISAMPGQSMVWVDTVTAGELVSFSPNFYDFNHCAGTGNTVLQTVSLQAYGEMFAAPMNPEGCSDPPCATLNPVTHNDTPLTNVFALSPLFTWQTTCDHLRMLPGQLAHAGEYDFVFKLTDSHCPVPGITYGLVRIVVLPYPRIASPEVKCIAVQPNGDLLLTWEPSSDTLNSFNSYQIMHSANPAGPFAAIDSIFTIQTGQWLHTGAGTQPGYYLIVARSGCFGMEVMPPADTLQSIHLQAAYPGAAGASFTLSWNDPVRPLSTSGSQVYEVWRQINNGSWSVVGVTTNTLWHDMDRICSDTVAYRIELADTANPAACRSVSNLLTGYFVDTLPPQKPVVQTVTVDQTTRKSLLTWNRTADEDFECYIVTTIPNPPAPPSYDTIWSPNDTVWTDMLSDPCTSVITYRVKTMDICGNVSQFSEPHNTMNLSVQILPGNTSALLSWAPYPAVVYNPGGGYTIWVAVNSGTPAYLNWLPPQSTSHIHSNLSPGDTLCYTLLANDPLQNLWSHSCEVCTDVPTQVTREVPLLFTVGQNIPNPATGQTLIPFSVPVAGKVELVVRHLTGQTLRHEEMIAQPGKNHFTLHAGDLPQGVYLYSIHYQGAVQTRKMTVW